MRKLIVWNLVTLDGLFEGPKKWDLDFHNTVWGDELEALSIEQLRTAGMLLFGRVTYEGMAAYWRTAKGTVADFMNHLPKGVVSRTLAKADWSNTRLLAGDAAEEVGKLKREPGNDIYIFGSARLVAGLRPSGSIDEYRICIVPVLLGAGEPLFKPGVPRENLTLIDSRPLKSGGVILRYKPVR